MKVTTIIPPAGIPITLSDEVIGYYADLAASQTIEYNAETRECAELMDEGDI